MVERRIVTILEGLSVEGSTEGTTRGCRRPSTKGKTRECCRPQGMSLRLIPTQGQEKTYKHKHGRKYWHYFCRIGNHPTGWPLLYKDTPTGCFVFTVSNVVCSSLNSCNACIYLALAECCYLCCLRLVWHLLLEIE